MKKMIGTKKVLATVFAVSAAFAMTACGNNAAPTTAQTTGETPVAETTVETTEAVTDEAQEENSAENNQIANPWTETTVDDMESEIGLKLAVPEGAEVTGCTVNKSQGIGQILFTMDGVDYCARIKSTDFLEDISGTYYTWDVEDDVMVDRCEGKFYQYVGDGETVQVCIWCDIVPGVSYSLMAVAPDLDGFDITAVAAQVFVPMQGEA